MVCLRVAVSACGREYVGVRVSVGCVRASAFVSQS